MVYKSRIPVVGSTFAHFLLVESFYNIERPVASGADKLCGLLGGSTACFQLQSIHRVSLFVLFCLEGQQEVLGGIIIGVIVDKSVALGCICFADEVGEQLAIGSLELSLGRIDINLGDGRACSAVNHVFGIISNLIVGSQAGGGLVNDIYTVLRNKILAVIGVSERCLVYATQRRCDELEFPSEVFACTIVVGIHITVLARSKVAACHTGVGAKEALGGSYTEETVG